MDRTLIVTVVAFAALAAGFIAVERLWPAVRGQRLLRAGWKTDAVYWLFTPIVSKNLSRLGIGVVLAILLLASGAKVNRENIEAALAGRDTWFSTWPLRVQAVSVLVLSDFTAYWLHRAFHRGWLWRVHAVHHSSRELDWLSAVRLHPLNELITRMVQVLPFYFLGFSPLVLAGVAPFLSLYAILLHANVNWSFGPLRYVMATPAFHRWHHTSEEEGLDKNFGGLLPLWDLIFGTFYMPPGKHPQVFGIVHHDMPESLWGQMTYPFRRARNTRAEKLAAQ